MSRSQQSTFTSGLYLISTTSSTAVTSLKACGFASSSYGRRTATSSPPRVPTVLKLASLISTMFNTFATGSLSSRTPTSLLMNYSTCSRPIVSFQSITLPSTTNSCEQVSATSDSSGLLLRETKMITQISSDRWPSTPQKSLDLSTRYLRMSVLSGDTMDKSKQGQHTCKSQPFYCGHCTSTVSCLTLQGFVSGTCVEGSLTKLGLLDWLEHSLIRRSMLSTAHCLISSCRCRNALPILVPSVSSSWTTPRSITTTRLLLLQIDLVCGSSTYCHTLLTSTQSRRLSQRSSTSSGDTGTTTLR